MPGPYDLSDGGGLGRKRTTRRPPNSEIAALRAELAGVKTELADAKFHLDFWASKEAHANAPALAAVCDIMGWTYTGDHREMAKATMAQLAEAQRDTARLDKLIDACNCAVCDYFSDSLWDDAVTGTDPDADIHDLIRAVIDRITYPEIPDNSFEAVRFSGVTHD